MKHSSKNLLFTLVLFVFMTLTAAVAPAPSISVQPNTIQVVTGTNVAPKPEKLTLKERISKKVFGKVVKSITKAKTKSAGKDKSKTAAALLAFFLGGLGIHRFYLGYTWQGVVQLLTAGGCGIWALIDFIRILMGKLKPKDGDYAK